MNPELITRLVSLVEKTGDRVVLADPATGKAVVVMDLASYERLSTGAVAQPIQAQPQTAPIREEKPVPPAPAREPEIEVVETRKTAQIREITSTEEKQVRTKPERRSAVEMPDLTQEELLDKINREIAAWKTAQEKKRSDELKAAARDIAPLPQAAVFEEEERFYLEPIE